jgi:hypothetical protein
MPIPIIWLLLAGGAVAALASKPRARGERPEVGESLMPSLAPSRQLGSVQQLEIARSLGPFGNAEPGEYPAPYRYRDARKIADLVLAAANETTGPKLRPDYEVIRDRSVSIDASQMPNAYKTYALVFTVVIPAIAANLFFNWYRPRSAQRKKVYAAIAAWAFMFSALPSTATADAVIRSGQFLGAGSYMLDGWADYMNPIGKLVTELSPLETRGLLNDLAWYLVQWPGNRYPSDDPEQWTNVYEVASEGRLNEWYAAYPYDGGNELILEGNFELVGFMLWWAMARVEMEIKLDFDEGAAWAALIVKVVAALASAAAAFVSPAIAVIIAAASNTIQGLAIAFTKGELSAKEFQALGGAAVALALKVAGVDLGLNSELEQVQGLME